MRKSGDRAAAIGDRSKISKLLQRRFQVRAGLTNSPHAVEGGNFVSRRTLSARQLQELLDRSPEAVLAAAPVRGKNPVAPTRFIVQLTPEAALRFPNTPGAAPWKGTHG